MMTIDFDKLRIILMPHVLRQGILLEVLFRTVYVPLKRIYASFTAYVGKEEKERTYGPTVKQLRTAIADHLAIDPDLVLFGEVEDRDTMDIPGEESGEFVLLGLAPTPEGQEEDHAERVADIKGLWSDDEIWWNREFTVSLPGAYSTNRAEVEALLERWKMAGSNYTIIFR